MDNPKYHRNPSTRLDQRYCSVAFILSFPPFPWFHSRASWLLKLKLKSCIQNSPQAPQPNSMIIFTKKGAQNANSVSFGRESRQISKFAARYLQCKILFFCTRFCVCEGQWRVHSRWNSLRNRAPIGEQSGDWKYKNCPLGTWRQGSGQSTVTIFLFLFNKNAPLSTHRMSISCLLPFMQSSLQTIDVVQSPRNVRSREGVYRCKFDTIIYFWFMLISLSQTHTTTTSQPTNPAPANPAAMYDPVRDCAPVSSEALSQNIKYMLISLLQAHTTTTPHPTNPGSTRAYDPVREAAVSGWLNALIHTKILISLLKKDTAAMLPPPPRQTPAVIHWIG